MLYKCMVHEDNASAIGNNDIVHEEGHGGGGSGGDMFSGLMEEEAGGSGSEAGGMFEVRCSQMLG